jgi:hypothetical protein
LNRTILVYKNEIRKLEKITKNKTEEINILTNNLERETNFNKTMLSVGIRNHFNLNQNKK